jgi:hypothetical protein
VVVRVFVAWTEVAVSCVSRRRRRLSQLCATTPPASLRSPRWPPIVGPVCIGPIDPAPNPKLVEEGRPNTTFASATSDAFFERAENRVRAQGSQRALIDGDHSFAKALRNFENLEALAAPNSIIAIHDVVPMTWMPERHVEGRDSVPNRRLMAAIVKRPDLVAFTVACPPFCLGIVGRFIKRNQLPEENPLML